MCYLKERNVSSIRNRFLASFAQLNGIVHATWEPKPYNRVQREKEIQDRLNRISDKHNAKFSDLLVKQLTELRGNGFVEICGNKYPYILSEIILTIANIVDGKIKSKEFNRKKSNLFQRNIFHAHHSQTHYMLFNCIRYFRRHYKSDNDVFKDIDILVRQYPDRNDYVALLANNIFMKSLSWDERTGEWIVYEMFDEKINFLCLYVHRDDSKNDEKLAKLIEGCCLST
jgi:hypothetical protein